MGHDYENGRIKEQLNDEASRASALLSNRVQAKRDEARRGLDDEPPRKPEPQNLIEFARRNVVYIMAVVGVVLAVALGIVIASALMPEPASLGDAAGDEAAYVSPYDWTKLDRTDGRFRYLVDGREKSRLGVDVSENQHEIDWEAVANDGIDFAMIRVGYRGATAGDLYLDEYYESNMVGARKAGLDCGAYFFSQASTVDEAREEAEFVLQHIAGARLAYPIAFDSERSVSGVATSRTAGLSNDEMTAIATAFCDRVKAAGYSTVIYGNAIDLSRYNYDELAKHEIWWAEYGTAMPAATIDIDLWQYSNGGQVQGIPTAVDMNIDLRGVLE